MGQVVYWRNHILVTMVVALGIIPKGIVDVHKMLLRTASYLTQGGETEIFTPMYMILCRKLDLPMVAQDPSSS
ncbi:hypothetical protein CDL15_Pgr006986 [Punica granatum]|uniref:Sterol methyltransferase C-terminal domain-containing protein n=1 Tax=Punica granatum TaxID=22663 RepID=A0A218X6T4_PUNGR|nr:hypothetical protein CDL15_Pgr006986 [Punica granatum]